jgi:hypothetical protein
MAHLQPAAVEPDIGLGVVDVKGGGAFERGEIVAGAVGDGERAGHEA